MASKPKKIWLVAQAPDGTGLILPHKTAAGYNYASVVQGLNGWELTGIWGYTSQSVSKRTVTALARGADFQVVLVAPMENSVPEIISSYFGTARDLVISQIFRPGKGGWQDVRHLNQRPTIAILRLMMGEGITAVGISIRTGISDSSHDRVADFQLDQVIRAGKPLFGGSLIGSRTR